LDGVVKKVSRFGAYGIMIRDGALLLTKKQSGPYEGKWDLPGGGIEFGETPEEALIREILEETAYWAGELQLFGVESYSEVTFHHVGVIFRVLDFEREPEADPGEECCWVSLSEAASVEFTPFAARVILKDGLINGSAEKFSKIFGNNDDCSSMLTVDG
jgi:mutator protein MutT